MRKRMILVLLVALLLSGCGFGSGLREPVNFYYPQTQEAIAADGALEGYILPEPRESAGHSGDLEYLLSLYLAGPTQETLRSPFPTGTRLVSITQTEGSLVINMNERFSQLSGIDLTLACACICTTCFDLTDVNQITITAPAAGLYPEVEMTMTRDSLTLVDNSTQPPELG